LCRKKQQRHYVAVDAIISEPKSSYGARESEEREREREREREMQPAGERYVERKSLFLFILINGAMCHRSS
jgi:hypothetical protein